MTDLQRLRDIVPIALAVYLATNIAQIWTAPAPAAQRVDWQRLAAGLEWHLQEIARAESEERVFALGN